MNKKETKIETIVRELAKNGIETEKDLHSAKRKAAKKYKISCPKNVQLLKTYHKLLENKRLKPSKTLEGLFRTRPVRSLSGIINVSVLTKPYPCPGRCIYCPTQEKIPKSYLEGEPAVQRAVLTKFNPYLQVETRLKSLKKTGHPTDKIELRIIGGTWSYYPKKYQIWFIKECFRAANNFLYKRREPQNQGQGRALTSYGLLEKEQKRNEKTRCRIIGITIETRPDFINIEEIKRLRNLGVTRVELGVQSIYNDVLKLIQRGHNIEATIKATKDLKDAGFKISYQIMPNLPGSNFTKDVKMFEKLFGDSDFCPDLLKIYPLALVKQSILYKWYKNKKFKPHSKKKLIKLLIEIKKRIPYYCRIHRIIRDIPAENIAEGGAKISNLREIALKEMKKMGIFCKCIRCREIKKGYNKKEKIFLHRENYNASGGKEIFLSYEDKERKLIYALLRLRIPPFALSELRGNKPFFKHFIPALQDTAIIREIHTYGQLLPLGSSASQLSPQHKGLGKKLITEAEKITKKEFKLKKIAVIAGIGTRDYFRKLGYALKDTYMIKKLK